MTTFAPSAASRVAIAAPIPREPPVTSATLLLNLQRKRGNTTSTDHLVRSFADRFWSVEWPGASRPRVYFDPRALEADGHGGVLHAKAVVADDEVQTSRWHGRSVHDR